MDRPAWKQSVVKLPPPDAAEADRFGNHTIEWACDQFRKRYGNRLDHDTLLVQDLEEICSRFLLFLYRNRLRCLKKVAPNRREAYLRRILENRVKRYFQRIRKQREAQVWLTDTGAEDEDGEVATLDVLPGDGKSPEETVMDRITVEEIRAFARTLKPNEQNVYFHVFEHGLTEKETSELLGMPEGTVNSHVSRIRRKLQAHWREREL